MPIPGDLEDSLMDTSVFRKTARVQIENSVLDIRPMDGILSLSGSKNGFRWIDVLPILTGFHLLFCLVQPIRQQSKCSLRQDLFLARVVPVRMDNFGDGPVISL